MAGSMTIAKKKPDPVRRIRRMVAIAAKKPGYGKHQLYAEIYDARGERISFGWNHAGRSDLLAHYVRHSKVDGTCAEAAAVIQALSRYRSVVGSTLLIARAKKPYRGGPVVSGIAYPCEGCRRLIRDFGILNAFYSTDDWGVEEYQVYKDEDT